MPAFTKSRGALALAFVAVALATGCAPADGKQAAAEAAKPAPCTIVEKFDGGTYNVNRVIDFETDVVVYKMGYGESGIAATPFSQLTPKAQQKMETLRRTLPAHCQ